MKTKHRRRLRLLGKASFLVLTAGNASAQQPDSVELPSVKVIATRPLPDIGTPVERIPSNVQAVTATELRAHQSLNLPDFLSQSLPGVTINEAQNNPFQPDVNFRGFTASPLLGTAQGLSVFVDGVRINEPFGDTVNWDLIPMNAISSMSLIPGSNPLFGLNTLGALSIQTKTGAQYPGVSLQASGGSWGRRSAEFEYGGKRGNVDWFLSGNLFREDGWRDFSPSRVRQLFGKLGWETATTDIDLSYTHADNDLTGNGFTPESMLRADREASFTYPDNTRNRLDFFNGRLSHWFSDNLLFSGNVYHRQNRVRTFNGDVNDEYADEFEELIEAGGECALDADPEACAVAAMAGETGVNNRTTTRQRGYGLSAQLTAIGKTASGENQLTAGFAVDKSRTRFEQSEQEAVLTPSRGTASDEETELVTRLRGSSRTWSLYATDTFSWNGLLHFTLSGRYNHTNVELDDRLGTELDGRHTFRRFNPAAGISYTPFGSLTLFAGYSEGNRAPSPIELGCADPEIPCKLPNAMAADPPLKQVVAKTSEIGARGRIAGIDWSTALFHTINRDDIQFIASSSTGAGYFDNVGKTRRRGVEFNLAGEHGRLRWNLGYAYVDATYRSALRVLGENNSTADDDGFIDVEPGSRIPGIPRHSVKLGGSFRVTDAWTIGATATAYSDQYARGNENNRHRPGTNAEGEEFEGSGRIPGYVIVNLDTKYAVAPGWEAFAKVSNIFDRRYSSAGILGENPFGAGGFNPEPDEWRRGDGPGAGRAEGRMDRNPCELPVTMVANAEYTEAPAVLARELRVPAAGSPIRSRGSGGLRANPIHARIKRDVATVVLITIGTFLLSSTFEVYENWFGWTRDFESMQIDELPLTFLVMAIAIGWFAWRRAQEFGSELRLRMLAEVKLVDSEEQYRRLSRRYLEAQESERRHLARELHDELGQYLNAIKIDAVALRDYTKSSGGDARRSAATIVDLTDHVYGVVRTLMSQLRPVALDELGLIPALQHCIEGWRMRLPQLGFDLFANEGELGMLDEQVRLTAFRIVQESLTNAARHARATRVSVMLGREAGTIRAVVQDDGIGMDAKTRTNGLGLVGMRDRVEALGGTLSIRSSPQFGTRIEARIPLVVRDDVARPEAIDDRGPAG